MYLPPSPLKGAIIVEVDPDVIDLVPMFVDNRRKEIEVLRAAVERGDAEEVREIGHRMKGIGGGYGFDYVSIAGAALESLARAGNLDEMPQWIAGLGDYLARVEPVEGPGED